MKHFSYVFILILATAGCSRFQRSVPNEQEREQTAKVLNSEQAVEETEKEIIEANADLKPSDEEASIGRSENQPHIPSEINKNVRKWIYYFSVQEPERFHRFLKRGNQYKTLVKKILNDHGVPSELYYLAMIESGFVIQARSHARAVGPWQFMPATGKRYGLSQSRFVDERQDIVRATEAAAKYLKNLHNVFQSWYLAMAAYNAGEGRIMGAIMRGESRNFWDLVEKRVLPTETRDYVPKFLAAMIIGKHPEKYGFRNIDAEPFPAVEGVDVPGGVRFSHIAKHGDVSVEDLKNVNPHLLRSMTPADQRTYTLWVPEGKAKGIMEARSTLAKLKVSYRELASENSRRSYHVVKRGENLGQIARKYGLSVRSIKNINGLKSSQIFPGKRLRVAARESRSSVRRIVHRVRRGEALSRISEKYGVSISKLKRLNDLRGSKIYVGQRLIVSKDI